MFLQLQVYWQQPVAFSPRIMIGGEIFTCHDLADLQAARRFAAAKPEALVYRIVRDAQDVSQVPVDLDTLIAETAYELDGDFQCHYRGLLRQED